MKSCRMCIHYRCWGDCMEYDLRGICKDYKEKRKNNGISDICKAKRAELKERYPKCESVINFLCCCNSKGEPNMNNTEIIKHIIETMISVSEHTDKDFEALRWLFLQYDSACLEVIRNDKR